MRFIRFDRVLDLIRKLSKDDYWQAIYNYNKENTGINIFSNDKEFTKLQVIFLNYLGFYYTLHFDINSGDVNKLVLDNEVYEDSYFYYKSESRKKKEKKTDKNNIAMTDNKYHKSETVNKNQWVFTKVKGK